MNGAGVRSSDTNPTPIRTASRAASVSQLDAQRIDQVGVASPKRGVVGCARVNIKAPGTPGVCERSGRLAGCDGAPIDSLLITESSRERPGSAGFSTRSL